MKVGQIERKTQDRIVKLFQDNLDYTYLGNWEERQENSNIEKELLQKYLKGKYHDDLINKVQLIGHLGNAPEVKTTENGKKLARFSVATEWPWRNVSHGHNMPQLPRRGKNCH